MTAKVEKLDADLELPFDELVFASDDPKLLKEYILLLVKTLQENLRVNATVTNLGIDQTDGDAIYYALKSVDGTYPEGTWRRIQVGDNLEDQVLLDGDSLSGTWTMAQRRKRPKT